MLTAAASAHATSRHGAGAAPPSATPAVHGSSLVRGPMLLGGMLARPGLRSPTNLRGARLCPRVAALRWAGGLLLLGRGLLLRSRTGLLLLAGRGALLASGGRRAAGGGEGGAAATTREGWRLMRCFLSRRLQT